jgi:gliding motility-associated-like protein
MKAIKQIFIALLAVFFIGIIAKQTQAQCDIDGTAFPTTLCAGDQITLLSDGTCGYLMSNDFNNGTIGAGWSSANANPVFTNPCPLPGPSAGPNGFYCWVGTTASPERTLVTNPYDVSIGGCKVEFWMRYGIEPNSGPCEDPDWIDEGVYLEYRVGTGAWTTFPAPNLEPVGNLSLFPPFSTVTPGTGGYWEPYSSLSQQQQSTIYHWNYYVCPVPAAANSTNTQFRWAQKNNSSAGWDAWGIDEVNISCPTPLANFAWVTPATGDTVFFVQNPPTFTINSPNNPSTITGGQYDTCWFVSIWDSLGFAATDTVCVTVNPVPTADFTVTSPICEDEIATVTYTGTGGSGASYSWYFSGATILNGTMGTAGPFDLQWTLPGTQWISLQVTENGCSSPTVYDSIIVHDTPEVWFQADTTEGCVPVTINFTNLSNPPGSNWVWDFGDGSTSTQENPSHTYTSHGDYTVTLAVSTNEGCDDTLTWNNYIHIYPQPVAEFTMDPDPAKPGVPVNFNSTSVGDTWLWDFGDGNSSTDANFTTHTYQNPNTYTVTLYISNMYGCIDSLSQELLCIDLEFPNVFTPNGDGVNDCFEIKGADLLASDVNITKLLVYNRWGKKVFEAENYQNDWDGGNLADGVYFYVFEYLETESYSGSLTILRGN